MSEMVKYIGKLEKIDLQGSTLHEKVHELCSKNKWYNKWFKDKGEDYYYEMLMECTDDCMIYKNELYRYTKESQDLYDSVFEVFRNEDGTLGYVVSYYNGGCSFTEAIGYGLDKLR